MPIDFIVLNWYNSSIVLMEMDELKGGGEMAHVGQMAVSNGMEQKPQYVGFWRGFFFQEFNMTGLTRRGFGLFLFLSVAAFTMVGLVSVISSLIFYTVTFQAQGGLSIRQSAIVLGGILFGGFIMHTSLSWYFKLVDLVQVKK